MIDMYVTLILNKEDWTIDRVPASYKEAVIAELKKRESENR